MPVAKKLGLGFSLTPYSSVGYRTKYTQDFDPNDPVWGNVGRVQYVYQGEGDVTEVKVGLGWEISRISRWVSRRSITGATSTAAS